MLASGARRAVVLALVALLAAGCGARPSVGSGAAGAHSGSRAAGTPPSAHARSGSGAKTRNSTSGDTSRPKTAAPSATTTTGGTGASALKRGTAPSTDTSGGHASSTEQTATPPPVPSNAPAPVTAEAVVIGNNPDARPQAGLAHASVVWEILAEGWITRYLAIFSQSGAAQIGPVRSTRIYFDQLASDYRIPLAHAGGNVDALNAIAPLHIQNLDEIYGSGPYFWRGRTRVPPNNLYTSTTLLNRAVTAARFPHHPLTYPAQGTLPTGGTPTAAVSLDYLTDPPVYTYVAGWKWAGGWWNRTINGRASIDQDGAQLRAGTVILLVARQAPDPDPYTIGAIKILWQDGGAAWVLRDGVRLAGTWVQGANGLPVVRTSGGDILPAGRRAPIWYEVVPSARDVSFTA